MVIDVRQKILLSVHVLWGVYGELFLFAAFLAMTYHVLPVALNTEQTVVVWHIPKRGLMPFCLLLCSLVARSLASESAKVMIRV